MTTKVAIVEDDEPTLRLIVDIISQAPNLTLAKLCRNAQEALRELPKENPDVVLMDINLPQLSGVECVGILKPNMKKTQFLMLTVYNDEDHIFAALAAGATGYLLKGTRRDELLTAIEQILAGGSPMSSGIARKVVQSFSVEVNNAEQDNGLSPRENIVLSLLTKGYMYKEIADHLGVSVWTVSSFIRRIYEKLQVHSRSQAVAKFLGKR